jgi:hypothetical protein
MAYAILKGLGAPAEVSSATLDARSAACASCQGCSVSVERTSPTEIAFTRRDQRLPLNLGLIGILSYRFVPIPDELNQYMLAVENLEPGLYEITVDQRKVGAFASQRLAEGVNLGSATPDPWEPGGPWDAQASSLRPLTDARNDLVVSARLAAWQMPENPNRAQMAEQAARLNEQTEELQRLTARPVDYHYVVRRIDAPKPR